MDSNPPSYQIKPYPLSRRIVVDILDFARNKHITHGLVEMDVTLPRQILQAHRSQTGESLSFTAFFIHCLAKALAEQPDIQAYRDWRGRLIVFEDVDVNTIVEHEVQGRKLGTVYLVRGANRKSFLQIHQEIRQAQSETIKPSRHPGWVFYLILPGFLRRAFWRLLFKYPLQLKRLVGTTVVTAIGMFGQGGGWAVPISYMTAGASLGGISTRPAFIDDQVQPREFLCVTMSFDHDVVDGAPAARFTSRLRELVESAAGLEVLIS
jgi:pyruvate/2-oxoglutarate dehydrogenase complex dihydrolipoamide acyltransferase (E2) component